jgi:hypothetical protein
MADLRVDQQATSSFSGHLVWALPLSRRQHLRRPEKGGTVGVDVRPTGDPSASKPATSVPGLALHCLVLILEPQSNHRGKPPPRRTEQLAIQSGLFRAKCLRRVAADYAARASWADARLPVVGRYQVLVQGHRAGHSGVLLQDSWRQASQQEPTSNQRTVVHPSWQAVNSASEPPK